MVRGVGRDGSSPGLQGGARARPLALYLIELLHVELIYILSNIYIELLILRD
ncbi:hypothetical protein D3C73_1341740 [compost metagenome]